MKSVNYQFALFISLVICINISKAQTLVPEGTISGNWSLLNSPYLVEGNITITDDSSLTIEPGVKVEFQGHYELNVHGVLLAVGTEADTILFTINDTTGFSNVDTTLGGWNGINFRAIIPQNDTSRIIYSKIEYCKNVSPIWPDDSGGAILIEHSNKVLISNSVFNSNFAHWGGAIRIVYSELIISDCTFFNNHSSGFGGALAMDFSTIYLDNCDFIQNKSDFNCGAINSWKCELNIDQSNFIGNHSTTNYGAIGADSSTVTINNSKFQSNETIWGGGLAVNFGTLELTNSSFKENSAEHGGALISGWNETNITNVQFDNNIANWGGAMSITNCDLNILDCNFQNNSADEAGAFEYIADTMDFQELYNVNIVGTNFSKNTANVAVGTFRFIQNNSEISIVKLNVDDCSIINNSADRVNILISGFIRDFRLSNSTISGNSTTLRTAGFNFSNNVVGTVENCLFNSNYTAGGSSVASVGLNSSVAFMNCTVVNNYGENGGALTLRNNGSMLLLNSILWGNKPYNSVLAAVTDSTSCVLDIYYSDIQYGMDSLLINDSISVINWGSGNIEDHPLFVDSLSNYGLMDNSPCIGAGIDSILINDSWYYSPQNDLDGNARPSPEYSNPDMGAYEHSNGIPTDVKGNEVIPEKFELAQNYPNPFNPSTVIKYSIPIESKSERGKVKSVTLKIFDLLGREVVTLVNEKQKPGNYKVEFNASDLTSGIYFYRLLIIGSINSQGKAAKQQIGSEDILVETRKMVILK